MLLLLVNKRNTIGLRMDFKSDLIDIIREYFRKEGISYEEGADASKFATRYCEMQIRRIEPKPREVHFSSELHNSLGKLVRETTGEQNKKAQAAWGAVFFLRHHFVIGGDVRLYLSKRVNDSTSKDGLLWDYGIHHFHLSRQLDKSGFVKRSDYLLLALVDDSDAFFVDVRPHSDPKKLLWVRQDLLDIIDSNWPEITESHRLPGVRGDTITDLEKKELRRKNINSAPELGGRAIAPIGFGTVRAGSSLLCTHWALGLLREIDRLESYFHTQPVDLRTELERNGIRTSGDMEFHLVLLDSLEPSVEVVERLEQDDCLTQKLSRMGFAIVEATTQRLIAVSKKRETCPPSPRPA